MGNLELACVRSKSAKVWWCKAPVSSTNTGTWSPKDSIMWVMTTSSAPKLEACLRGRRSLATVLRRSKLSCK